MSFIKATVKSFSLADEAILVLDQIPKNERSAFVTAAILETAKHKIKLQSIEAIKGFPRFKAEGDTSVVETVREIRREAK